MRHLEIWASPEGIPHQTVMAQSFKSETSDYKEGRFSGLFRMWLSEKGDPQTGQKIVGPRANVLA
jgi:hypothetical protein